MQPLQYAIIWLGVLRNTIFMLTVCKSGFAISQPDKIVKI
jgi:hypothetical protein